MATARHTARAIHGGSEQAVIVWSWRDCCGIERAVKVVQVTASGSPPGHLMSCWALTWQLSHQAEPGFFPAVGPKCLKILSRTMSQNPPQTLSVKRKRDELPVDELHVEDRLPPEQKRQRKEIYAWKLVQKPGVSTPEPSLPSPAQPGRRFQFSSSAGSRVLIEARHPAHGQDIQCKNEATPSLPQGEAPSPSPIVAQQATTPRPRKRPGAGTAIHNAKPAAAENTPGSTAPSEEEVQRFEKFSKEVEKDELAMTRLPTSPIKYKPKAPALRYKERHPESAAHDGHGPDAMDVDEYVIDTYVREVIMPDADGNIPEPKGTVGIIVLNEGDEEWWNGDDESDREFDTDDDDENAEDYYANDYPEDELSSDDEYDRNLYQKKYRHGSDDEEYDLDHDDDSADGARSDGDEDEEHFRRVAPRSAPGYWGRFGE